MERGRDANMGLFPLLIRSPFAFFLLVIPLLYSIIFHELAHGLVAYRMGDPTAKLMGRLSLNPLRHLDPIGTLLLFLFGFGWAKPVPINPFNFRNSRSGMVKVSAAGITANVVIAFVALFVLQLFPAVSGTVALILYYVAQINIMLAAFNLIPIPPLDGSKILIGLLPARYEALLLRLEPYGFFIIVALLYLGILDPVIVFFRHLILFFIGLLLS